MPTKPLTEPVNEQEEEIVQDAEELYTPDFVFMPQGVHKYRQEGPYLICRGCELHHAVYVGMDKQMTGEDEDGKPILKEVGQ